MLVASLVSVTDYRNRDIVPLCEPLQVRKQPFYRRIVIWSFPLTPPRESDRRIQNHKLQGAWRIVQLIGQLARPDDGRFQVLVNIKR